MNEQQNQNFHSVHVCKVKMAFKAFIREKAVFFFDVSSTVSSALRHHQVLYICLEACVPSTIVCSSLTDLVQE